MKKFIMLLAAVVGSHSIAQDIKQGKINIATEVNREVAIDKDKESAKNFGLNTLQDASPLDINLIVVKGGYPGNAKLISACKESVLENLKAPATAQFARVNPPRYLFFGGTYIVSGKVDAQNSYGALIRNTFFCTMAYSGNAKAGLLYVNADVFSN